MVNDSVRIVRPFNFKKMFTWIFIVLFIGFVLAGVYVAGIIFGGHIAPRVQVNIVNPVSEILERIEQSSLNLTKEEVKKQVVEEAILKFDKSYIDYALYAMSASKLHNLPFTNNYPRIKVFLDPEIYSSKVLSGQISTINEDLENPDIIIFSSKEELIKAMLSEDMAFFMSNSVKEGRTNIEMVASSVILAGKGYIQMYEEITGESLI